MKGSSCSAQSREKHIESRAMKKSLGSFYTPQYLATLISDETLNRWLMKNGNMSSSSLDYLHELDESVRTNLLKQLKNIRILDPAVGGGAFLLAAADWLNTKRAELGDTLTSFDRRSHIVKNSLYGVDLVDQAIVVCKENLANWIKEDTQERHVIETGEVISIKRGNSLVGLINKEDHYSPEPREPIDALDAFHWHKEFDNVIHASELKFDVILGNPPYGNLLGASERRYIQKNYPSNVGGGHDGSWNSAAHFIVRARALMKDGGHLGFLVPNSILRVNQFSKTRRFLLDKMCLWKIVDEGSPFEGVTLEMVSLFCEATNDCLNRQIEIESRRPGYEQSNMVDVDVLGSSRVFSIYYDSILSTILKHGKRNLITASRGRDIPKEHVSDVKTREFKIPYITSGKSVRRYKIVTQRQYYTDDWYKRDQRLKESFEGDFLVATKNFRYPRCVMKPPGTIHGGGIVKITPINENIDRRVLGLILNSRLIQYICLRYLTNYSQLTTCLNTGIMEDLPLVIPRSLDTYAMLFDAVADLYAKSSTSLFEICRANIERLCDALVYELYFSRTHTLEDVVSAEFSTPMDSVELCSRLDDKRIVNRVGEIMKMPIVAEIERGLDT